MAGPWPVLLVILLVGCALPPKQRTPGPEPYPDLERPNSIGQPLTAEDLHQMINAAARESNAALQKLDRLEREIAQSSSCVEGLAAQKEKTLKTLTTELEFAAARLSLVNEELARMKHQIERENERGAKLAEEMRQLEEELLQLKGGPDSRQVEGKVLRVESGTGKMVINRGVQDGVKQWRRFTLYRGERFVGTASVIEIGSDSAVLLLDLKRLDPAAGDEAVSRPRRAIPEER